jgi:P2 family phage contractile tail tube protein
LDIQVNVLVNAGVYLLPAGIPAGGPIGAAGLGGLMGRAAEIEVPMPKQKMADYKGLGMVGTLEVWMGVDKLEASIKWSSFDPIVIMQIVNPFMPVSVQIMAAAMKYGSAGVSAQLPIIYLLTGTFKDPGNLMIKQHEQAEVASKISITHSECYVDGLQLYLYDVFSNTYMVNMVDQLTDFRTAMGAV